MKSSMLFSMFAGLSLLSSVAAADEVRFRGAFTVTSVKNCLARYVGETFNSAYRPAGLGDNPDITSFSQLNQYSGDVYELEGANFTPGRWIPVLAYGIDNIHYSFEARIFISKITPAVILPTTNQIDLNGTIVNMGNDAGVDGLKCVASFRGAYFRRVEFH